MEKYNETNNRGEFKQLIKKHPSWCLTLSEPLEITTCVDLNDSKITHLSPFLHFKVKDKDGSVARFFYCNNLKEACGNFYGFVSFTSSVVETTTDLKVKGIDINGWSADFYNCKYLKTLEGEFEGAIRIAFSNVEKPKQIIKNCSKEEIGIYPKGKKLFIQECPNLAPHIKYFKGEYYITNTKFKKEIKAIINKRKDISRFKN